MAHEELGPAKEPPTRPQSLADSERQLPFARQQAPVGCGHGVAQVVPTPRNVPLCEVQVTAVTSERHWPVGRQQAPLGHVVPLHATPAPCHSPPAVEQFADVNDRQFPFEKQQAPVGAGHVPHAEPTPWNTPDCDEH